MARLTAKQRSKLKASQFAEPDERKYPIFDKAHRRNALSRVAQFGSPSEKKKVRAAVERAEEKREKRPRKDEPKEKLRYRYGR